MSKQTEALKLALEALEVATTPLAKDRQEVLRAQAAIREALAEQLAHESAYQRGYMDGIAKGLRMEQPAQQQEPPTVAELLCVCGAEWEWRNRDWELVATPPPQRKPLTDEQIMEMYNEPRSDAEMIAFARAIEAAHGIGEQK